MPFRKDIFWRDHLEITFKNNLRWNVSDDEIRIFYWLACYSRILPSFFFLQLYFTLCFPFQHGPSFHCLLIMFIHVLQSSAIFSPAMAWLALTMEFGHVMLFLSCKLRSGPWEGGVGNSFLLLSTVLAAISSPLTNVTLNNAPGSNIWYLITFERY